MKKAASIRIIGGANGPTAVFVTQKPSHKLILPLLITAAMAITVAAAIYSKQK